jgi:hypothetical protein
MVKKTKLEFTFYDMINPINRNLVCYTHHKTEKLLIH